MAFAFTSFDDLPTDMDRILRTFQCRRTNPLAKSGKGACIEKGKIEMSDNLTARITIDPEICHGKPCIRGLRYPVEWLLELLSSGMTHEEILADYKDLENEDILATLAFAARLSQIKSVQEVLA
jgi:uncharacterized protein (DUF433 family)